MKKVILIDNYDSFTFNLVHAIEEILGYTIDVKKNDQININELENYDYFFLSPGPGLPDEAGVLKQVIERYKGTKSIFGVCLGLQAIVEVYGCSLKNLKKVYHGIKSKIDIKHPSILYHNIENPFTAGRYHSWVMDELSSFNNDIIVTARSIEGHIMSIEHKINRVYGVQYHPESFMTDEGIKILRNFLNET